MQTFILGQLYPDQAGVYAGIVRAPAGGHDWHLFIPTDIHAEFAKLAWGGYGVRNQGAESNNNGLANTQALIAADEIHPAADACSRLAINGLEDFYLPARNELRLAMINVPECFDRNVYWSSTQVSNSRDDAWQQYFDVDCQTLSHKNSQNRVRAVRRELV